jgi:hypothetical protein
MNQHLAVNPIACTGHGICAEMLPELIGLDEWGYPILSGRDVPARARIARPPRGPAVPHARAAAGGRGC